MSTKVKYINEGGSIVVISLLTLALLSLLGIASTTRSQTDISIAGNSKDMEVSLYAAEIALVHGENSIKNFDPYKKSDGINTSGHSDIGNKEIEDYSGPKISDIDFSPESSVPSSGSTDSKIENIAIEINSSDMPEEWKDNMSTIPRYHIKQYGFVRDCQNVGENDCGNTGIDIYKVIAMGEGRSEKTSTTLEATFHWRSR